MSTPHSSQSPVIDLLAAIVACVKAKPDGGIKTAQLLRAIADDLVPPVERTQRDVALGNTKREALIAAWYEGNRAGWEDAQREREFYDAPAVEGVDPPAQNVNPYKEQS
jgi:hypothetical protein